MSNPSARELTDALRTFKKPSVKQNIATFMKERASQIASKIASKIVIAKKNIEPIVSLAKPVYMPYKETDEKKTIIPEVNQIEPEIEEQEEQEEKEQIQFDNVYESDDELQYAINASLQHQEEETIRREKIVLMRMLEEANRKNVMLQREKEEESIAIMRLYEEDKKRREKEEEEKEEQRKCDELYKEFREKVASFMHHISSQQNYNTPIVYRILSSLIVSLEKMGEILLSIMHGCPEREDFRGHGIIITNKNIYYSTICWTTEHGSMSLPKSTLSILYTFLEKLNSKYMKLLKHSNAVHRILPSTNQFGADNLIEVKRAESIIRCIPGSYINGHWKQLDGFFGPYFNEETIEISLVPPPLELK